MPSTSIRAAPSPANFTVEAQARGNHSLKTAGMIGYVCTLRAGLAGIPSVRE